MRHDSTSAQPFDAPPQFKVCTECSNTYCLFAMHIFVCEQCSAVAFHMWKLETTQHPYGPHAAEMQPIEGGWKTTNQSLLSL